MPTGTNRIPNSDSVSTVPSSLSHSFSVLQKDRPLSPSPHTVTSVITLKSGPTITSTVLLAAGVFAGLVVVSLIIARVIDYLFQKPTPPKVDLTKRDIKNISAPTTVDSSAQTSPTMPPPAAESAVDNSTPPPNAPTNGSDSTTSSQIQPAP
ncbi:MAG TPA: hypothetical protein VFU89_01215, partial [Rhabdochlamydiaceae bacterium]|nr:hypothetical protein [Rhabdochlamydiaceae bacterium]